MKKFFIMFLMLSSCGTTFPVDNTPRWDQNNRYAVEQSNDCNLTKHSVGVSGCAFHAGAVGGNLVLPAIYYGAVQFQSANCRSFSVPADKIVNNVIPLRDVYNALNGESCSFAITRTVIVDKKQFDRSMLGRFFIKILPADGTVSKLKFSVGSEDFDGVGWYQRKDTTQDATLTIKPTGQRGIFKIWCGSSLVYHIEYTHSPFQVELNSPQSCDYEMTAVNEDNPDNESATYLHSVSTYTEDITTPQVTVKNNKITFNFTEKDSTGKDYMVVGTKINDNVICEGEHSCTTAAGQENYIIRAVTPAARFFYGLYTPSTGKWEVK